MRKVNEKIVCKCNCHDKPKDHKGYGCCDKVNEPRVKPPSIWSIKMEEARREERKLLHSSLLEKLPKVKESHKDIQLDLIRQGEIYYRSKVRLLLSELLGGKGRKG